MPQNPKIPIYQQPVTTPQTGVCDMVWYRFFQDLTTQKKDVDGGSP
jgi:hypothetical protein